MNHSKIYVEFIDELKLTQDSKNQITTLLKLAFTEENFNGRHYFKQFPHYRLILRKQDKVIGQVALDFRVMTLNHQPISMLGIIDFCITPTFQNQGLGRFLMSKLMDQANEVKENIDFLFLVTNRPSFYQPFGFKSTTQWVRWLVTEEHVNYEMKEECIENALMYKKIGNKEWIENTTLDLMGYWY